MGPGDWGSLKGSGLPLLSGAGEKGLFFLYDPNHDGPSLGDEGSEVNLGRSGEMPALVCASIVGTGGRGAYSGLLFLGVDGDAVMLSLEEGISHSVPLLFLKPVFLGFGQRCTKLVALGCQLPNNIFQ